MLTLRVGFYSRTDVFDISFDSFRTLDWTYPKDTFLDSLTLLSIEKPKAIYTNLIIKKPMHFKIIYLYCDYKDRTELIIRAKFGSLFINFVKRNYCDL
jgi:hypothetical protein